MFDMKRFYKLTFTTVFNLLAPHNLQNCNANTYLMFGQSRAVDLSTVAFTLFSIDKQLELYAHVLKLYGRNKTLPKGKRLHTHILKSRYESHVFLTNNLITMYAKCGSLLDARQVFEKMSQRDAVSWTALIAGYVGNGDGIEALHLFRQMRGEGIKMDRFSLCSVLRGSAGMTALESGQQFHTHVIKLRLEGDVIVGSALVDMYAKCACLESAHKVFDGMPERNVVTWTAMVCGYARSGQSEEFFHLFGQMQRLRVEFNFVTYVSVLGAFSNLGLPEHGKQVHACIVKVGLPEDVYVANALISMYVKCASMEDACKVFDTLPNTNVVSWTTMIAGYAQLEHCEEALKLFIQMCNANQSPNQFTYASVIKACAADGAIEQGRQIHSYVIRTGNERHVYVGNALVNLYDKCGSMQSAQKVFEEILMPDVISYTTLLAGFARTEHCIEALDLFCIMLQSGMGIDNFVFATVLSASASLGALGMGNQLHTHAIKAGFEYDIYIQNAIVDMYIKCRSIKDAGEVFDKMLHKDVPSWNAMISGYSQSGYGENALKLFLQMQEGGIDKEVSAFTSVLRASASLAVVEQGRQVHALITKSGYESDVSVGNTLADMYAKSGKIHSAHKVFDNMPKKDSVTYNVMISGYSHHGQGKKALQFFEKMQLAHMPPNDITFICVLSACSHVGLVNEGRNYFSSMTRDHNIKPRMEHYACMVDLLSRAGCFDEAESFIREMPFQPAALIWRTLLGACRIHGNIELGKHAAKCALELEPQDPATYVLMSNMFVGANLHTDAANLRKLMKDRGVRKELGQSWIQLKDEVHSFKGEDTFNSQTVRLVK